MTGIPVIDGDGMGRAFPEVQMSTFFIYGLDPSPGAIAASSRRFTPTTIAVRVLLE